MQKIVLILGPTGRLGRTAARAFEDAGWEVRRFDRQHDTLWDAAWGAHVIVNGWNPPYPDWEAEVPAQTVQIIEVARAANATVILPGNVYVYGTQAPETFGADTPHLAQNPLGRVRVDMEATFRAAGIQTIVVRAGDYIDTQASGNWFDMIITQPVAKGAISYPGPLDVPHSFTYLPDVAATMVALAQKRDTLGRFEDVAVPSFVLTGAQLANAISNVVGHPVKAKRMAWWPIRIASSVWPLGRGLVEMSYLWRKPHHLDPTRHRDLCPDVAMTPLPVALARGLNVDVDPDEAMRTGSEAIVA